jgi:hypothetical protein
MIAQARLTSGFSTTTAWVDLLPGVRVGAVISLKGDERQWTIDSLGAPREREDITNLGRRHREVQGGLQ